MYPFPVILVGFRDDVLPQVRRELAHCSAQIEGECRDVASLFQHERTASEWTGTEAAPAGRRLYLVHLKTAQDLRDLTSVSANFAGQPILALMDQDNPELSVIRAMREGVSQVVMLPLDSEDFQAALRRLVQQFGPPTASGSNVLAVSGVSGGCGATTVALNLAFKLAQRHQVQTILAELSPQKSALATYLNIQPRVTLRDLLRDVERQGAFAVQKAVTRVDKNLEILAGPYEAIAPAAVDTQEVLQLIECTRRLAEVVILDVPCTFDSLHFETLAAADQIVLLAEQKVLSLRTLKLMREALARAAVVRPQHVVINRYDPKIAGLTRSDLEKFLDVPQVHTLSNDFRAVNAALNHGRPLRAEAPHSPVLADLDALAHCLVGLRRQAAKSSGLFGQLRRVLGKK